MELGIYTFVENTPGPDGGIRPPNERMRDLLEEAQLADQLDLDVFAVGEHHRLEYLSSAPAVILGALAARTRSIRLSSAVSVLSSDDPVRVFQQFSTLDLLSNGRAEIMAGRGSFIESFPLFGYDLEDYDELFEEKLKMLLQIRDNDVVSIGGKHRKPITELGIYPRPLQNPLPVWLAVGGSPQSAVRAGLLGLPMALAIIGGDPARFRGFVELYRESARLHGNEEQVQVGINCHGFLAATSQEAAEISYPPFEFVMSRIGKERGWSPTSRQQFDSMRAPKGALLVGSPAEVVDKILYEYELFQNSRLLLQFSVGTIDHRQIMKSIELFGAVVAPEIRRALARN